MTDNGPVVRSGDDGRVLWWVDTDGRTTTAGQAEGIVLVAAGGVLAGFDARSGDRSWCQDGPTGPVVDAGAGDRLLARVDGTRTLLDTSNGSVVAELPGEVEEHALMSEVRVSSCPGPPGASGFRSEREKPTPGRGLPVGRRLDRSAHGTTCAC